MLERAKGIEEADTKYRKGQSKQTLLVKHTGLLVGQFIFVWKR